VTRLLFVGAALGVLALGVAAAQAKDFHPGDIRVCNAKRCVAIANPEVVPELGAFYYSGPPLERVRAPRLGAPAFRLTFRNGYVTGIVAAARLDRFLSYGVHLERFERDVWYRVPPALAAELRTLTRDLAPLRVTPAALRRSR
jgi:hypothetical protein